MPVIPVRQRFIHVVVDSSNPRSLASRLRRRRFRLVERELAASPAPVRVLDVGGTAGFWHGLGRSLDDLELTVVNANPEHSRVGSVEVHRGDARSLPEFADDSFDLVFSNSVIEHVGGPADQRAMADEIRRIGRRWVVQTPSRWFPIEPHFLFPYFNFLPLRVKVFLLTRLRLGWAQAPSVDASAAEARARGIQLVPLARFRAMFPDGELRRERLGVLTKSYIVVGPITPPGVERTSAITPPVRRGRHGRGRR